MLKKIISAVVSIALLLSAVPAAPAVERGEKVTLIVELEGASLLEMKNAAALGAVMFMETAEARTAEAGILSVQTSVKSDIKKIVSADVDDGYTYTSVFNGFSMQGYISDIDSIKAIDGVKNVYISRDHAVPDMPAAAGAELMETGNVGPEVGADMMNAGYMYDLGYDGRHQAIAILDTEFDVNHEFFAEGVKEPKLTKGDIDRLLKDGGLNINASADQVYKSSKIPFAYDYGEEKADTYSLAKVHGTHVAGVAAGKNGHHNGTEFSGTAPEAQLVLMKVSDERGYLPDYVSLKAFDDASKMGVCAVNYSIGREVLSWCFDDVIQNLRNAGIIVMVGAGNDDRAPETADHPDYVYLSNPALLDTATAVASIDANLIWAIENKMTLGSSDIVIYNYSDDEGFFAKFSDKFYDYVVITGGSDITGADLRGKIAVCPYDVYNDRESEFEFSDAEALIVVLDEAQDNKSTSLGDKPVVFVRSSSGDILYASTDKKLRTADKPEYYQLTKEPEMSYFSNWGTNTTLELKPEVTAPGGNIFSSVPGNDYANWSGTSMATPHMTGAAALMCGFMEKKYPNVKGADKVALMENLFMSSASIVMCGGDDPIPESPRRQGAGLVDLEAAAKLPVILIGDYGKSKLSLGDMLDDEIELTFTAKNLTNRNVTYDDVKLYLMTDNYETQGGINYISDQVPLSFTSDAKKRYTVPAGGETEITINISLDKAETKKNLSIFTNGFFVDGFVELSNSETKASLPFTGFYGDWTSFSAMTPTYFEEGGSEASGGLMSDSGDILGRNLILKKMLESGKASESEYAPEEYEGEKYVGYSPDGDGIFDYMHIGLYMRRCLTDEIAVITNAANRNEYWLIELDRGLSRSKEGIYECVLEEYDDYNNNIPDGDYILNISGRLAYDSDRSGIEEKEFIFYIDTADPVVSNMRIYDSGGKTYAAFSASDNRYLMGAIAYKGEEEIAMVPVKPSNSAEIVLDVTGAEIDMLEFKVFDYAGNVTSFTFGSVNAKLVADPIWSGNSLKLTLNVDNVGEAVNADIIAATYSADGMLLCAASHNLFLESGQQIEQSFNLTDSEAAAYAKVFIWKHGAPVPVSGAYHIRLK
ncbi:MAG: S8 family serine peptidase [Oscillospiraceae bacterium]|nr:S8 family serine peptidase [Oscillospiraceae bacterium]